MREQIEYVISIGAEDTFLNRQKFHNAIPELAGCLSVLCGGCTIINGTGYWAEDGATHKTTFTGHIHKELSYVIKLSCELHKADDVYNSIKISVQSMKEAHNLNIQWIHCQEFKFIGKHFEV
jgi:hypothetical protein